MGVVSFRISDEDEATLRRVGVNPGALAKKAVEAEARRASAEALLAALAPFRRKLDKTAAEIIREDRDSH